MPRVTTLLRAGRAVRLGQKPMQAERVRPQPRSQDLSPANPVNQKSLSFFQKSNSFFQNLYLLKFKSNPSKPEPKPF
jgi:hypothetical protein